jgi:hypothetical protein
MQRPKALREKRRNKEIFRNHITTFSDVTTKKIQTQESPERENERKCPERN